ncbi:MAG: zinc-dependent metalloprotease [Polyangiaceae bacterium]|nr:zinc-dependent metalloprotease [Polyangiaceae bacterium]
MAVGAAARFWPYFLSVTGAVAVACSFSDAASTIRFVNLLQCSGCSDVTPYEAILSALHHANDTFKAAGIQFALRSVERYYLADFVDLRPDDPCGGPGDDDREWQAVKDQLRAVFPAAPSNAWGDTENKTIRTWLRAVETLYGKPEELVVFLAENTSCGNGSWGAFPWEGRNVVLHATAPLSSSPYKMAHELGHHFGLVHTFNNDTSRDPETNAARTNADSWDLVYKPGTSSANPHQFFSNWSAANAQLPSLRRIDQRATYDAGPDGSNVVYSTCSQDGGTVTCTLGSGPPGPDGGVPGYKETYSTGAQQLKGTAFTFASGQGSNAMSYMGPYNAAFSDAQIGLIRKHIRWDYQLDQAKSDEIKPGATISGRRPQLGAWDIKAPEANLDFDGDYRRDIGVWIPPTNMVDLGRFIVLLSSMGFSTSAGTTIDVEFGKLGDIPVPADYDGDGRTDVAVFQPGGGVGRGNVLESTGYWRWCTTWSIPNSTVCGHDGTSPSPIAWGYRDTVPQPGLNFTDQPGYTLAYYAPVNGEWGWMTSAGSQTRQLGSAGSVPLPGLYDGDYKTDLAVYGPADATFRLLRSEQNWGPVTARAFDSKFIPQPSGTSVQRGMALPMAGMTHGYWLGWSWVRRRSFSLWFPPDGTWTTLWDPINSSTPSPSCQWGWGAMDVPLPGIDRNGDGLSEMAVFRAPDYSYVPGVFMKASRSNDCAGQQYSNLWYAGLKRTRTRSFVVADMTGDGLAEIVFIQPDTMTITRATSESGYSSTYTVQIGNQRAIFL